MQNLDMFWFGLHILVLETGRILISRYSGVTSLVAGSSMSYLPACFFDTIAIGSGIDKVQGLRWPKEGLTAVTDHSPYGRNIRLRHIQP